MIKFGRYVNSPECFWVNYLDIHDFKEKSLHVHISEVRRFYGESPKDRILYDDSALIKFFTWRLEFEGQNGEYGKKKARAQVRLNAKQSTSKPHSPGKGEK